jgi:hypothetical protein
MTKKQLIEAILSHLMAVRKEGGERLYFGALTAREDSVDNETFGDLVDALIAKES